MRCKLCGGWARQLPAEGSHNLCIERNKRGLPTPSLGEQCQRCQGRGHLGKNQNGVMIYTDAGPQAFARSIEAVFPKCPDCDGRGIISN